MAGLGVPIKLLHEAEGHVVTVELKTGEVYRGKMLEAEDNFNCQLESVTVTARDGRISTLETAYIRGSMIRYLIIPDMLKNAPFFRMQEAPKGMGRGRAVALKRAKAAAQRGGRGGPGAPGGGGRGRGRF